MLKELQDELKTVSSAAEVPKEAGQSLASRAAAPAAKPAPIVGAWLHLHARSFAVLISQILCCGVARACFRLFTLCAAQAPALARQRSSGQPYPLMSGGFPVG
jgi:hypothetical protein